MEEKQWIGMALPLWGHYFGGFQVHRCNSSKMQSFKCRVAVRSALTFSRFITILLSYIQDGIRIFDIFKNQRLW